MTVTNANTPDRLIKVSFNPKLIDKTPPDNKAWLTQGFEPYEVTPDQFCQTINQGTPPLKAASLAARVSAAR
jgi:hypothetical protein